MVASRSPYQSRRGKCMPKRMSNIFLLLAFFLPQVIWAHGQSNVPEPIQQLAQVRPAERLMRGGDVHKYQVGLSAGQYLKVVVDQRGVDVVALSFWRTTPTSPGATP